MGAPTDSTGCDAQMLSSLPPLSEIVRQVRDQAHRGYRQNLVQHQLHRTQRALARMTRLSSAHQSVFRTMSECVRAQDKSRFAELDGAFRAVHDNCLRPITHPVDGTQQAPSFLDEMSQPCRAIVLQLLSRLRLDLTFITETLCALTHGGLLALLSKRSSWRTSSSVFAGSGPQSPQASKVMRTSVADDIRTVKLAMFGSPLETLVEYTRHMSHGENHHDDHALEIWAKICATFVVNQTPGCEKIIPAVLDIWAATLQWTGRSRLQCWLSQVLRDGAFLLESPEKQSYKTGVERRPEGQIDLGSRSEEFFRMAVDSFLDLLCDQRDGNIIPAPALEICRKVWRVMQQHPNRRQVFPSFVLIRWLTPFMSDCITFPEASLNMELHILGLTARRHTG